MHGVVAACVLHVLVHFVTIIVDKDLTNFVLDLGLIFGFQGE